MASRPPTSPRTWRPTRCCRGGDGSRATASSTSGSARSSSARASSPRSPSSPPTSWTSSSRRSGCCRPTPPPARTRAHRRQPLDQDSGAAVRLACANVRALFVADGRARAGRRARRGRRGARPDSARGRAAQTSYGDLAARSTLESRRTRRRAVNRVAARARRRAATPRLDLPDKVAGRPRYIHDLRLPGQLFGGASGRRPGARADRVDGPAPGTASDRRPRRSFLGVSGPTRAGSCAPRSACAARRPGPRRDLPDEDDLDAFLRAAARDDRGRGPAQQPAPPPRPRDCGRRTAGRSSHTRRWRRAAASRGGTTRQAGRCGATARASTPSGRDRRRAAASTRPRSSCEHVEGAGCYGHNGADDAAFDAVLLARAVPGRPVQVLWSRAGRAGVGAVRLGDGGRRRAALDAAGAVRRGATTSAARATLAAGLRRRPRPAGRRRRSPSRRPPRRRRPAGGRGGGRCATRCPATTSRGRRIARAPAAATRRSAPRRCASLGAYLNVFAIESFMDELAAAGRRRPARLPAARTCATRGRGGAARPRPAAGWGPRCATGRARHRVRPLQGRGRVLRGGRRGRGGAPRSGCAGWWSPSTSAGW